MRPRTSSCCRSRRMVCDVTPYSWARFMTDAPPSRSIDSIMCCRRSSADSFAILGDRRAGMDLDDSCKGSRPRPQERGRSAALLADCFPPLVEDRLSSAEFVDGLQLDELEAGERGHVARAGDVRADRPTACFLD